MCLTLLQKVTSCCDGRKQQHGPGSRPAATFSVAAGSLVSRIIPINQKNPAAAEKLKVAVARAHWHATGLLLKLVIHHLHLALFKPSPIYRVMARQLSDCTESADEA